MSTEAQLDFAKAEWLFAAKQARAVKELSKKYYDYEREAGIVDKETFDQWVINNSPGFVNAYQEFQTKSARYQAIFHDHDKEKAEAWQQEYASKWAEKYNGPGQENQSNYLIITPEF
ncbi:hypothetical protein N7478_003725 [Penicillium angulare]|uniref:uncharacterized protein n=1 Tax=Penicillium angulare TaxID=116970 RepID=UPI0025422C56|nr:uncharacterized protein N7478_003725 [Penicillium angulare]KAJ5288039.1 hypothetical protein N7478_003725 [Penicillium angulare]